MFNKDACRENLQASFYRVAMKRLIILSALLFFIGSCNNTEIENEEEMVLKMNLDESDAWERVILVDHNLNRLVKIESLSWEKQTEEFGSEYLQVEAYIDETGFPAKIIEYYIDGNMQPQGQRNYYLEDNKIVAYFEQRDIWIDENTTEYQEKRTIYEDGTPMVTQIRKSSYFGDIEEIEWEDTEVETHSLQTVQDILAGEGRFETHFISVIRGQNLFLLLGENKEEIKNRYTTAVMVQEMTPFIEDLLAHLDEYKFRPVNIEFKVIGGGEEEPEYRVLTGISWKN